MSDKEESNNFETWEEVINDFLQRKFEAEEEKYLKEVIKVVAKQYGNQKFYNNHEIEKFFDPKKNKKTEFQSSIEFQRLKFKHLFDFSERPEGLNLVMLEDNYLQRCNKLAEKYEPHAWIAKASHDASNVSFATHVSKLTHSKIDTPSFCDQVSSQKRGILATTNLKKLIIDGAVSGNQFAPVFQFLQLELEGNKLVSVFDDESNTILQGFTETPEELRSWNVGFKQALTDSNVSTHFLAKQVYFPVTQKSPLLLESYHLLCNVKSSSLAHAIFEKLRDTDQKKIKKSLEKNKYNILPKTSFVGKASLKVTASNPS
ncbi:type I-F CRISPR-associated protein Csy1, partial [Desulfobacterota bacterium M19]